MTDDETGRLEHEIHIDAPPETVFRFLVEPGKMNTWMGIEAEVEARPGGLFRVNVTGADVVRGEVIEVAPPKRLVFSWGWEGGEIVPPGASRVEITLTPEKGGTLLRLVHSGLPEAVVERHAEGWAHYAERLRLAAGGADPGSDPWLARDREGDRQ